jgi:hypothetical protein
MSQQTVNPMHAPAQGDAPEGQISRHMAVRGLMVSPFLVALAGFIWGLNGAWSALFGIGLVIFNYVLAASLISITARISLALMMGAVLFGYVIRLGIIFAAVMLVKDTGWISLPALGCTIIVTHLGLLFWEMRHVSATLAFPGLKPKPGMNDSPNPSTN